RRRQSGIVLPAQFAQPLDAARGVSQSAVALETKPARFAARRLRFPRGTDLLPFFFVFPKNQKSRARLASPQPRPTSPVNGAGGITGCRDDAQSPESFRL